jgi:deoxyhypusine synthase
MSVRRVQDFKNLYFYRGHVKQPYIRNGMSVVELVEEWGKSEAFNAGRLYEACIIYEKMLKDRNDVSVCLTLSGAMVPAGYGGIIIELIKRGLIDWIVSTGANIYHDLHFCIAAPPYKGDFRADDRKLRRYGLERIYDIFITEDHHLLKTDKYLLDVFSIENFLGRDDKTESSSDLHYLLGRYLLDNSSLPEQSFVAQAAKYKVPIFCPSPGDSTIGMVQSTMLLEKKDLFTDWRLDVLETTAIVYSSRKNGAIEIGGGAPKNFFMQTQLVLSQCLFINKGGHDYFIQITTDRPDVGGLSGATPQEAVSWKKIKVGDANQVTVYCDATIAFPIIASYVIDKIGKRPHKKLYEKKGEFLKKLRRRYLRYLRKYQGRKTRATTQAP